MNDEYQKTKQDVVHALQFAEAREWALIDFINGKSPHIDYSVDDIIDRQMYVRVVANNGETSSLFEFTSPDYLSSDIEDALRIEGYNEFVITIFDEHYISHKDHIWYEGMKRFYKPLPFENEVTVHIAPAGTISD